MPGANRIKQRYSIFNSVPKATYSVEGSREHDEPESAEKLTTRFECTNAAVRGRSVNRPPRLRSQGERNHTGGDGSRGPTTRTAGRVLAIVWVPSGRWIEITELSGMSLPKDNRSSTTQHSYDFGVSVAGTGIGPNPTSRPRWMTRHVDKIFDANGNAVKRSPDMPALHLLAEPPCFF